MKFARPDADKFEAYFGTNPDPWNTFSDRDEARKRRAIRLALGPRPHARIWELAAGNGSNSVMLARRGFHLDATEGSAAGTRLVEKALAPFPPARAARLQLPERPPRPTYDAVLAAEIFYYLTDRELDRTIARIGEALRPGGLLVLAHQTRNFADFTQDARGVHRRMARAPFPLTRCHVERALHWEVVALRRPLA